MISETLDQPRARVAQAVVSSEWFSSGSKNSAEKPRTRIRLIEAPERFAERTNRAATRGARTAPTTSGRATGSKDIMLKPLTMKRRTGPTHSAQGLPVDWAIIGGTSVRPGMVFARDSSHGGEESGHQG